jgi:hypothetical protein
MRIFAEGFSDIGAPERVAEMLRDGVARSLEAGPFVSMLGGRDRHQFALVEPDQRRIGHILRRHHDLWG